MTPAAEIRFALMMVTSPAGPPSLDEAARLLGVPTEACDPVFGVVTISPDRHLYSIRVDAAQLPPAEDDPAGPFADPPIGPFDMR